MELWTEKYRPKKGNEIIGNKEALSDLRRHIGNYKKRAILIYGPSGIGKTIAVKVIANELNFEVIELNASDARDEKNINSVLGEAVKQRSLFSKGKIILVDELDGINNKDRGFVKAILNLIEISDYPIVMIANELKNPALSQLKRKSIAIKFEPISAAETYNLLSKIARHETVNIEDSLLKTLSYLSGGDIRGAITDLQSLSFSKEIKKADLDTLGSRNKLELISNALIKIFKSSDMNIASSALSNISEDIDECFLWLEENIPNEYKKPDDLARAYDALSLADVYRGRIRNRQHWRFLVYANSLATSGIALAKKQKYSHIVKYNRSSRILNMWIAKSRYANRKNIAQKLSSKMHASKKELIKNSIPYLKIIFKNKKMANEIAREYDLSPEEINWLNK